MIQFGLRNTSYITIFKNRLLQFEKTLRKNKYKMRWDIK